MKKLILLLLVLVLNSDLIAQRWYTDVDKEISVNTAFRIEFILESSKGSGFRNPSFKGFKLLSGPGQSTSTQIINGRASSKQSYYYDLFAEKEGVYTIGSASIQVGGKLLKTEPVKVTVIKGDDIESMLSGSNDAIVLKMELSDTVAFPGQQVMLQYTLYDDGNNRYNGVVDDDSFEEMFAKRIPTTLRPKVSVQNGKRYQSRLVGNTAIFPQKSGVFPIKEATVKIGIPLESNRPSGFFSFKRYSTKFVTSNNATLRVVDLPAGAPPSFNGAVGKYTLEGNINKQKTTTDDAVILNLKVKGNGDNRMVEPPEIKSDAYWEVYEPTVVDENEYLEDNQIFSYKTFEYLLLPKQTGRLKIQPSFAYYDTDSSSYQIITTRPVYVDVSAGTRKVLEDDSKVLSDRTIEGPMNVLAGEIGRKNPFTSIPFLSFMFLGVLGMIGMLYNRRKLDEYYSLSPEERKRREALKKAKLSLSKAKALMEAKDSKNFYEEVSLAMNGFIADKFNITHAEISRERINSVLENHYENTSIPAEYMKILKSCELALFANQNQDEQMSRVYNSSLDLLSKIQSTESSK